MKRKIQKSRRDLPGLRKWADTLIHFSERTISKIRYAQDDHLGFMALCFLSKQIDHMKSMMKIFPSRDAILIARSMIEGLCQLLWAASKPEELPLRWRAYSIIYDWRLIKQKESGGETVPEDKQELTYDKLAMHGHIFLKRKFKTSHFKVENIEGDPFQNNWRDNHKIETICRNVGADVLYEKAYRQFSAWHHWDASGLGQAIKRKGHKVVYTSLSESDSALALGVGFQCLIETIDLTNSHLNLGLEKNISDIKEGYIRWHSKRGNI